MSEALENDPTNVCIGCGPANPRGLQLAFERTVDGARTTLRATSDLEGWPGRLHSAMLYMAMLETANWSLYAKHERVGLPTRTSALEAARWVATGETLRIEGRVDTATDGGALVRVEAFDATTRPVARLERAYALPDRATFLQKMGYDKLPASLEGAMPS